MKGTSLECFEDLMRRLQSSQSFHEKRRILAGVLGVEDSTIRRWMNGSVGPVGLSMIGIRYYLDLLGYQVAELVPLSGVMKDAGRLLAFKVVSYEEMARLTNYTEHPSALLAVLRGTRGISSEREVLFREVVDAYRGDLAVTIKAIPRLVDLGPVATREQYVEITAEPTNGAHKQTDAQTASVKSVRNTKAELFRGLIINLIDSAEYYFQPSVSEKEREKMRDVVGQENIFDLKNMLYRLCSSKAFNNY